MRLWEGGEKQDISIICSKNKNHRTSCTNPPQEGTITKMKLVNNTSHLTKAQQYSTYIKEELIL